jgi:hypothetical protein
LVAPVTTPAWRAPSPSSTGPCGGAEPAGSRSRRGT